MIRKDFSTISADSGNDDRAVLLIAPQVPPYGGMGLQAKLLCDRMNAEGISASFLASNLPFSGRLRFLERLRGVRPFLRSAWFCWRLWSGLSRTETVHILACSWMYFFFVVSPAVLISRLRGRIVNLNYHGGEAEDFLRRYGPLVKPIFRMASVVSAPSKFLVEVIRRRIGVRVEVVPNIVDFGFLVYRERKPLRPSMIVTRHLEALYDVGSVIRAFKEVQAHCPEASLRIAGTGSQETYLRRLVSTLNLENVIFLGYVPHQDLPAIYDQCDILVNASRADNFPGSLLEAAAQGLVIISTGVGGIPFIFENGKSALLVKPGDSAGLAAAVLRVLDSPDLASRLAKQALQVCQQCDWTNVRRLLYQIYGFESQPAADSERRREVTSVGQTRHP
jgi:glycosyltransferase involved in cell wall biosynthesis